MTTEDYFLIGALCLCSFMIGRSWAYWRSEDTIASVIENLIDEGYIGSHINRDGDLELVKLCDLGKHNGQNSTSSDEE